MTVLTLSGISSLHIYAVNNLVKKASLFKVSESTFLAFCLLLLLPEF